nr:hypothetical protein [uncultured Campylobacter sp.]
MDSKSGLEHAGDREMCAFKFSLLAVLIWVFCVHFGGFLITRASNARYARYLRAQILAIGSA